MKIKSFPSEYKNVIESSQNPTKDPVMKRILKNKNSEIVKRILKREFPLWLSGNKSN